MSSTENIPANVDGQLLADSMERFGFRVFAKLAVASAGNQVFSPLSLFAPLLMLWAGAAGQTADEIQHCLQTVLSLDRLGEAYRRLRSETETGGVDLRIANRIWCHHHYPFNPDFCEFLNRFFESNFHGVDFADPIAASQTINDWVADATGGRIRELIKPSLLRQTTRLIITSGVYFQGTWNHQFEEAHTEEAPFWLTSTESTPVPMMKQTEFFRYAEDDLMQMVELPYKAVGMQMIAMSDAGDEEPGQCMLDNTAGSNFVMNVLLPSPGVRCEDIEERLASGYAPPWNARSERQVVLAMPRFRIEADFDVTRALTELGMQQAFSQREADFSRMTADPEGLFVKAILQRAFVDVNEQGTEAAAMTVVMMAAGCANFQRPPKVVVRVDRPFLFVIRDRESGAIYFMGRVNNPADRW